MAVVGDAPIVDFVATARTRLLVIVPAMTTQVAASVANTALRLAGQVTVIVDTDAKVYRLGYGDQGSPQAFHISRRMCVFDAYCEFVGLVR